MGLTKQYLRYVPAGNFNIIASANCNLCFVALEGQEGRYVAAGACEHIVIWDLRLGEKAQVLSGEKSPVTYISASPNKRNIAGGYTDGNVQIFDLKTAEMVTIFAGHRSEVTCISYDSFGHKLATGSKDTDIIVWDTVSETGICRLSGHKGPITQVQFTTNLPYLISSSKDSFIKLWDLDTQHCFNTLVAHRTEVWSISLMKDDRYLVSASSDAELRVWKLKDKNSSDDIENITESLQLAAIEETEHTSAYALQTFKAGSLLRSGRGRVISMFSDVTGQVIGCHGTDMQIELFMFLSDDDAKTRLKKRLKKERKKNAETSMEIPEDSTTAILSLRDEVKRLPVIKLSAKPKSLHVVLGNGGELRVTVVLANNTIELYSVQTSGKEAEPRCLRTVSMHGHHGEVRAVNFSSDNLAIVSGSSESIKMWNRPSQMSLRTVESGYVLCTLFVPGDRHILAGLKDGRLLIVDIAAGDILEEIPAHSNELWSMCLQPDLKGIVTGGGDKTVKFWQFELVVDESLESKAKVLSLIHTRTLKLEEGVLCVRLSPNKKFIAVALLDSTVKLFFVDSFKFYLSLYGHKLPVLCMDISSDSTLIATGSADRNVKIWGMDFGDCHKSIFAHDDSVTGLQFVNRTHYFFTCGKDGKVKQWDADAFVKVITLQGHIGEAWSLAVSPNGQFVVSCGADRVLRLYEKTDQPLVLQDEEEEERENQEGLATGEQSVIAGQPGKTLPSKKTIGSEKAAESILECLDVCKEYKEVLTDHAALQAGTAQVLPPPAIPLLMQAFAATTIDDFVLETLKRIRPSDMEEALLILPFSSVCELIEYLPALIARGDFIELVLKVVMFLLKIHHAPIVANHALLATLKNIRKLSSQKTEELKDTIGYNLYGMQFVQRELEAAEGVRLFRDATLERKRGEKKRKQRERVKRSIMMVS